MKNLYKVKETATEFAAAWDEGRLVCSKSIILWHSYSNNKNNQHTSARLNVLLSLWKSFTPDNSQSQDTHSFRSHSERRWRGWMDQVACFGSPSHLNEHTTFDELLVSYSTFCWKFPWLIISHPSNNTVAGSTHQWPAGIGKVPNACGGAGTCFLNLLDGFIEDPCTSCTWFLLLALHDSKGSSLNPKEMLEGLIWLGTTKPSDLGEQFSSVSDKYPLDQELDWKQGIAVLNRTSL